MRRISQTGCFCTSPAAGGKQEKETAAMAAVGLPADAGFGG